MFSLPSSVPCGLLSVIALLDFKDVSRTNHVVFVFLQSDLPQEGAQQTTGSVAVQA